MAADPVLSFLGNFQRQLLFQRELNIEAMAEQSRNTRFEASLAEQQAGRLQSFRLQKERIEAEKGRFDITSGQADRRIDISQGQLNLSERKLGLAQQPDPVAGFDLIQRVTAAVGKNPNLLALGKETLVNSPDAMAALLARGGSTDLSSFFQDPAAVDPREILAQREVDVQDLAGGPGTGIGRRLITGIPASTTAQGSIFQDEAFGGLFAPPATQATEQGDVLRKKVVTEAQESINPVVRAANQAANTLTLDTDTELGRVKVTKKGFFGGKDQIAFEEIKTQYLIWKDLTFYDEQTDDVKIRMDRTFDAQVQSLGGEDRVVNWNPDSAEVKALRRQ